MSLFGNRTKPQSMPRSRLEGLYEATTAAADTETKTYTVDPAPLIDTARYPTDNDYHEEIDYQYMYNSSYYMYFGFGIAKSPEYWYYITPMGYLKRINCDTLESGYVCGKEGCQHEEKYSHIYSEDRSGLVDECGSYQDVDTMLYYSDETLYAVFPSRISHQRKELYRIQTETGEIEKLRNFDSGFIRRLALIHRGKLYMGMSLPDENWDYTAGIWAYDLNDLEAEPRLVCEVDINDWEGNAQDGEFHTHRIQAYGHYLYLIGRDSLRRVDLNEPAKGIEEIAVSGDPESYFVDMTFDDGRLIAKTALEIGEGENASWKFDIWASDCGDLLEWKLLYDDIHPGSEIMAADGYLYSMDYVDVQEILVYDLTDNLVETIPIQVVSEEKRIRPMMPFLSHGNYVLFCCWDWDDTYRWYLDKREIGTGNAEIRELTDGTVLN